MAEIAKEHGSLDGVVAVTGIQKIMPALEYRASGVSEMLAVNYTGVMMAATSAARQMMKYRSCRSICRIASISGIEANKGFVSPVYNSSKAAVIHLARNLAIISPGHILTPMVKKNFEEVQGLKEDWEKEIMMGRLPETQEFKSAALFLLSDASKYMTGSNLVIDGGHSSW